MKRGYVDTRLGQLHYGEEGDRQAPPLILLPKTARTWRMFDGLAAALSADFRVIALDYPGTGYSDPLPHSTSFETVAASLIDAMDGLGIAQAAVYGVLTGNKIGAAMAAGWPGRISKLMLVGQSHSLVPSREKRQQTVGKRRRDPSANDERDAALLRWADAFNRVNAHWWNEATLKNIADEPTRRHTLSLIIDELLTTESIPDLYRANHAYDLEGDFRRISVPTLIVEVVTPSEDLAVGRQGAAVQALIAGSQLIVLEDEDYHGITLEKRVPEVAAIVRAFLQG